MRGAWGMFPYEAMDCKAAQAYLDDRARDGWVLKKVHLGLLARFEPGAGRSHFVDLDLRRGIDTDPDPVYLQLCEDAGWELVQRFRGMLLFRSRPETRPAPIQTDTGMEMERFWRKYVLRHLLVSGSVLPIALLTVLLLLKLAPGSGVALTRWPLSNSALLYGLMLTLMLVQLLWSGGSTISYFRRCRRLGRLAVPGRRGSAARGCLAVAISLLMFSAATLSIAENHGMTTFLNLQWSDYRPEHDATLEACRAYPIVAGTDLGLDEADTSTRYLEGRRSLLAEALSYHEWIRADGDDVHILTTERYACVSDALARYMLSGRRYETGQKGQFAWGILEWHEVPGLGFDESWTAEEGAYLLLRQGGVVALVGATGFDLTAPDSLEMLRSRLQLNESQGR